MNDDFEKLRHNPEKGLSGGEKDSDKKRSKKAEKKSEESSNHESRERPASFFKKKDSDSSENKGIFAKKESEHEEKTPEKQPSAENGSEVQNEEHEKEAESLSEQEVRDTASQITQARQEVVAEHLSHVDEESPDEAEELAAAAYLTNVERHLGSGEDFTEEMLDRATTEALDDLQYDSNQEVLLNDEENSDVADTIDEELEAEGDDDEEIQHQNTNASSNSSMTATQQTYQPSRPHHSPQLPVTPPVSPSNSNNNSGNTFFPPPSIPPTPPPQNPGFYNRYFSGPPGGNAANTLHSTPATSTHEYNDRRRRAKHLLVGGIVGYIIGRRGGRKRTEKRLQPQIDALEKQVTTLHDEIIRREEAIRTIARKQAERDNTLLYAHRKNDKETAVDKQKESSSPLKTSNKERIQGFVAKQQERQEKQKKQQLTERLHEDGSIKKMAEVHLSGLTMFVERRAIDGQENTRKRFEHMNEQELKQQAKDIVVDGVSVAAAYESKRINRDTLLEVTKRYWRKGSGSYETVFRNNVRPHEQELNKHRERLDKAHEDTQSKKTLSPEEKAERAREHAKTLADEFYERDPSTLETDEERRAYFQRYSDEDVQGSEFGKLLKKAQNGSLIKRKTGWITLLFVLVITAVLWFITGSLF